MSGLLPGKVFPCWAHATVPDSDTSNTLARKGHCELRSEKASDVQNIIIHMKNEYRYVYIFKITGDIDNIKQQR